MANANESPDYDWLVESGTKVQELTLNVYKALVRHRDALEKNDDWRSIYALIVGAAFSLWRAVFLVVDANRDPKLLLDAIDKFLRSVVGDNAITYQDDRKNRSWTAGYYLNNATYRMRRIIEKFDKLGVSPGTEQGRTFEKLKEILREGIDKKTTLVAELGAAYESVKAALTLLESIMDLRVGE